MITPEFGCTYAGHAFARAVGFCAWMLAAAVALGLAAPTMASAARTDTVVLQNGDRLRGEVRSLERGQLEFSTSAMSTVHVEWDKVVEVTASGVFEVEMADGSRFIGSPAAATPGKMGLALADGRTLTLDFLSVVRLRTIGSVWWQRLTGGISLGASYTASSGIGQGTLASYVTFRRPAFEVETSFDSTVSVDDEKVSSSRASFRSSYTRMLPNRWFLPGIARVERNAELGYNLRGIFGGGVGRFLWRSNRGAFGVGGGAVYDRELPVVGSATNGMDAMLMVNGSYFRHDTPETDVAISAAAFPSLSDTGRYRVEVNGSITRDIIGDFNIGLTFFYSYDNRPPSPGALRRDVGGNLTIGWSF